MRQPIDLVGGFYTDESLPWSCQDTVNWIPVAAEVGGTRTPTKLVDAPGLRPWVWIGNHADGVDSAPIRGLHDVEGQLFAVCGQTLYRIRPDGIAIPLGTIPGVGRVSMSHNQQAVGNQLLVVNGTGGYVWNTGTEEFTVVTDDGYPGAFAVDFLDGYLMQVEPFGRFLFHSDLADALDYNTLDRFEAETAPDRVVGMIVNHREVWAFGERTIDIFDNVGTATGTFQNKGISLSRGCIAKWSPAVIDNGIAWLGDDRVVYHARGYDAVRISTRAIEVALAEIPLTDIRNAFSFVWADRGHAVYYLTVPNGQTFGYDFSTGLWHRRASWHPERDISGRWRLNDLVRHNGRWIGGDYQTGKLYELDWDYMLEGTEPLVRERVSPVAHVDGRRFSVDSVELLYDTGGPESDPSKFPWPIQPVGPTIDGDAPGWMLGHPYPEFSYTVTAGDVPVISVGVIGGEFPPGLSLDNAGEITGVPTKMGQYTFTVRAVDSNGLYDWLNDDIEIGPAEILITGLPISQSGPAAAYASPVYSWHTIPRQDENLGSSAPVAYGDGWWVACENGQSYRSKDLVVWEHGNAPNVGSITDSMAFGEGVFLCTGSGGIFFRSADYGANFEDILTESGVPPAALPGSIAFGGGRFMLATRYQGGEVWSIREGGTVFENKGTPLFTGSGGWANGAAYGDGVWTVVGGYSSGQKCRLATTSNGGDTWSSITYLSNDAVAEDVAFGSGRWVVICENGATVTSTDKWISHTVHASALPADQWRVAFDGLRFWAMGSASGLYWSTDGVAWTGPVTTGISPTNVSFMATSHTND